MSAWASARAPGFVTAALAPLVASVHAIAILREKVTALTWHG
jgi:hypothetical protein